MKMNYAAGKKNQITTKKVVHSKPQFLTIVGKTLASETFIFICK